MYKSVHDRKRRQHLSLPKRLVGDALALLNFCRIACRSQGVARVRQRLYVFSVMLVRLYTSVAGHKLRSVQRLRKGDHSMCTRRSVVYQG